MHPNHQGGYGTERIRANTHWSTKAASDASLASDGRWAQTEQTKEKAMARHPQAALRSLRPTTPGPQGRCKLLQQGASSRFYHDRTCSDPTLLPRWPRHPRCTKRRIPKMTPKGDQINQSGLQSAPAARQEPPKKQQKARPCRRTTANGILKDLVKTRSANYFATSSHMQTDRICMNGTQFHSLENALNTCNALALGGPS